MIYIDLREWLKPLFLFNKQNSTRKEPLQSTKFMLPEVRYLLPSEKNALEKEFNDLSARQPTNPEENQRLIEEIKTLHERASSMTLSTDPENMSPTQGQRPRKRFKIFGVEFFPTRS